GLWGGGIAAQFRKKYPYANKLYEDHCKIHLNLLGTCMLLPASKPQDLEEANIVILRLFTSDF
ncbi:hypothetical protein METBIDRAFT_39849, partial [Metschnikowia bicuspidata var. bicuspidata NRRL YB-4993]